MKTPGWKILGAGAVLMLGLADAYAQRMPQDSWFSLQETWGGSGSGNGQFNGPSGIAIGSNGLVFVLESGNNRIQVFTQDGAFVRKWGSSGSATGQFSHPYGLASDGNGNIFVADSGNNRIQVFAEDGTHLRSWSCPSPRAIAYADDGRIYVADDANKKVRSFETDGTVVSTWGTAGTLIGQFGDMQGLAIGQNGRVYVADAGVKSSTYADDGSRIQVFENDGAYVSHVLVGTYRAIFSCLARGRDNLIYYGHDGVYNDFEYASVDIAEGDLSLLHNIVVGSDPVAVAEGLDGRLYVGLRNNTVRVIRRTNFTTPVVQDEAAPLPKVVSCVQRPGSTYLDIDYAINDADDSEVTAAALAFVDGRDDLKSIIRLSTLVEGTATNLGAGITTGQKHRLTWNAAADWNTDFGSIEVEILAQDGGNLMGLHYLTIPSNGPNPELIVSREPITQSDMLSLWYWLIATNDAAIQVVSGAVYGTAAGYDGLMLASNTTTSASGRQFLFDRIGVRVTTPTELERARTASTPGTVNQWDPRVSVVPAGRPKKVNEYGFDTGDWGGDGWWVVPAP